MCLAPVDSDKLKLSAAAFRRETRWATESLVRGLFRRTELAKGLPWDGTFAEGRLLVGQLCFGVRVDEAIAAKFTPRALLARRFELERLGALDPTDPELYR